MFEIIPNWHPIFVHFTVALFCTSVLFYLLTYLGQYFQLRLPFVEFAIVARWSLWLVAVITIGTLAAGLYAFYTIPHDETSHLAMTIHRNWAVPTGILIILLALWSLWAYISNKKITLLFMIALIVVQVMLMITAWRGAELVFRYGLGVMSLPQHPEAGHHQYMD